MKAVGGYVLITLIAANANASEQQAVDRLTILPTEIIQEIDTQLFSPNTLFTRSAVSHHALYAVNKKMHEYKQQLPHKHLLQLAKIGNMHRLLAHAYLLTKKDWLTLCAQEREQAPKVRLKTHQSNLVVDGKKTINLVDGTLAALILESYREFLLDQSPRAHAIHAHLEKEYGATQKETPGTFYHDGTYLGIDKSKSSRLYQIDDCPFAYDIANGSYFACKKHNGNVSDESAWNLGGSFIFKDMIYKNHYYTLICNPDIKESVILKCKDRTTFFYAIDNCLAITKNADFCTLLRRYFCQKKDESIEYYSQGKPLRKIQQTLTYAHVFVFDGQADTLAFDQETQDIKAFDTHGSVLCALRIE